MDLKFFAELQKFIADGTIPRREFKAPALPPGVVPKNAAFALDSGGMGANYNWLNTQGGWCGLGFPGYTYLAELAQRSEYYEPNQVIATELTRRWITWEGGDEAKIDELKEAFEKFQVRDHVRQCVMHDGLFGRGQLYIRIKGQETDARRAQPLVVDDENKGATIPKGSLLGFKPIEPVWSTPYAYNSSDPTRDDFYQPEVWYVMGKSTHASRLLPFISRPLPDILKPSYNFSGMSLSQLIEPYVVRWLKGVDSVSRIINMFSLIYLSTDMQATLQGGDGADFFRRLQLFNAMRDNRGIAAINKSSEEFGQVTVPLTNLDKLVAQLQEHMAAPTHIPLVKLTGITPGGLNASSEEDLNVWYDWCGALQSNVLNPNIAAISKIVQLHLWGAVDPDITHSWVPLDTPTDKEEAEIRKADGDRDTAYVGAAVLAPEEVRERLRRDPTSGYSFISAEDAPEPLLETAELDEDGKQADHDRAGELADADHKREGENAERDHKHAKELERIKNQGKKKPA